MALRDKKRVAGLWVSGEGEGQNRQFADVGVRGVPPRGGDWRRPHAAGGRKKKLLKFELLTDPFWLLPKPSFSFTFWIYSWASFFFFLFPHGNKVLVFNVFGFEPSRF